MGYTGYRYLTLDEEGLTKFYEGALCPPSLQENEYVIVRDLLEKPIDYYIFRNGKLERIDKYPVIGNTFTGQMKPRNPEQYCALDLLRREDIPLKVITGRFGSGKTMACTIAAIDAVMAGKFERVIFVRNNVQVKDTDQLGALPGNADEKTLPYLMPFADHCGGIEGIQQLTAQGKLEVIPLAFLRGRSIRNSIIYSMESENLTRQHIQLIMARVDTGSQLWMDGDTKQRDRAIFESSQGLETMIAHLRGEPLFGYVHLIKTERSPVAALADLLD